MTKVKDRLPAAIDTPLGPITMVDGISFGMSVVGAIASADANRKILRRLGQINSKLDAIIKIQSQILQEIFNLRLFITEALFRQFQNEVQIHIESYMMRYNSYAQIGFKQIPDEELNDLANRLMDLAHTAGQCDFSAFPSFMLAASSALALRTVTDSPIDLKREWAGSFALRLSEWRNTDNPRGVVKAQEQSANDMANVLNQLEAFPTEVRISSPVLRDIDGGLVCQFFNVQLIDGDFELGFRPGSVVERRGECWDQIHRDPGDGGGPDGGGMASGGFFDQQATSKPDYGGIPSDGGTVYGLSYIDSKNQLRKTVIEEMRRGRDLIYMYKMIEYAERKMNILQTI